MWFTTYGHHKLKPTWPDSPSLQLRFAGGSSRSAKRQPIEFMAKSRLNGSPVELALRLDRFCMAAAKMAHDLTEQYIQKLEKFLDWLQP
jgi:hypothetical protein